MKKLIPILLCLLLLALPCAAAGSSNAPDAVIESLEAQYTLQRDGSCSVVMTASAVFTGTRTEFAFPLPEGARDVSVVGVGYTLQGGAAVLSLPQTDASYLDVSFTLSYRLPETASASRSGQSCYLRLLMPGRACAIERFTATITLPKPFEELPAFESGYYGELIENYLSVSVREGVITLSGTQALRDHESLSMTLALPVSYFDLRFIAGKTAAVDTALFWALALAAAVYWFLFLRNPFAIPPRQAMPPLAANAGTVPYLTTGQDADLALMVMHWASLGYLTIARTRKGKLYLKRQMDMGSERKGYEVRIFRSLFDRTDLCSAHSDEFRRVRAQTPLIVRGELERRVFSARGGKPVLLRLAGALCAALLCLCALDLSVAAQAWRWILIVPLTLLGGLAGWLIQPLGTCRLQRRTGRIALTALLGAAYLTVIALRAGLGGLLLACLLLELLIGLGLALGGRRTKQGFRLATELLGLRRHYRQVKSGALRETLRSDPQYFYRTLPFAEALRCGGRLAGTLGGALPESCTWLTSETQKPRTAAGFYRLFSQVLGELREQTELPAAAVLGRLLRGKKERSVRP